VEVLVKISQSELERQRYLERQRAERDAANQAAAFKRVQEEARTAKEKGKAIGRIQMLQQFLQQPEPSSEELDQLSQEDLVQLEDSLKRQLSDRKAVNGTTPPDKT
jgi:hypothetical protein